MNHIEKRLLEQYKVWRRGGEQSQPPLEGPPSGGIGGGGDIYGLGGRGGSPMQIDIGLGGASGGGGRTTVKPDLRAPSAARARDRAEAEKIRSQQQQIQQQNQPTKVEPPKAEPPKTQGKKDTTTTQSPAKTEPPKPEPGQTLSRKDQKNLDRYGTTDREKIANIRHKEAETRKIERETPMSTPAKAVATTGVVGGLGTAAATGYYAYKNPEEVGAAVGTTTDQVPSTVTIPPEATNQGGGTSRRGTTTGTDTDQGGGTTSQPSGEIDDDPSKDFRYKGLDDTDPGTKKSLGVNEQDDSAKQKFLQKVVGPESGGKHWIKNPLSSATGLYQFIKSTWDQTVAKARPGDPHYGVSFQDMPKNVEAQHAAARQIADNYAETIKQARMPNIPTSYYLLHGHGPTGVKIYQNPNSPLKDIYPEYVKNRRGETVRNPVYVQNKNLDPNKPAMQIISRMANVMGDKLSDVFPSARAADLPRQPDKTKNQQVSVPKDQSQPASSTQAKPEKLTGPTGPVTLTAADIAKLPPVERFGHILPGLTFNKQGGIADVGKKPYTLPDGRTVTDPTILRDIYKIQQQELKKAQALADKNDSSFLGKVGRVLGGELTSKVFAPDAAKKAPATVPAKDSLSPGEKIIDPAELPTSTKKDISSTSRAKKELSDFEKAFAAARKDQGAGGQFSFTDPKTGKTGTYTTAYASEKPDVRIDKKTKDLASVTNESQSINTELIDILRLAGRR